MKTRTWARRSTLVLAAASAVGCTLQRAELRKNAGELLGIPPKAAGEGRPEGVLIAPKRCALRVAIVTRPYQDPRINDALWSRADEQAVEPDARRNLEANGLRLGLIAGELPSELVELFAENAPASEKVVPTHVDVPDGDHTLIPIGAQVPEASLLLVRDGKAVGKEYGDARGVLRLSAAREGDEGVRLRFLPQVEHGPVRHGYAAAPQAGPFQPHQFVFKDGQQEELLRELSASVVVRRGQVAVIGARAERNHSLGDFLFHGEEPGGRLVQKVVLVWAEASRLNPGAAGPPDLRPVEPPVLPDMAPTNPTPMARMPEMNEAGSIRDPGKR